MICQCHDDLSHQVWYHNYLNHSLTATIFYTSMVTMTLEQNIICSETYLNSITYDKTIICRQLFAGYMVGSWPMKRKKNLYRMIMVNINMQTD